jgi:hypothetical protein
VKSKYLVVYDYGQGGVWSFIYARDAIEITTKYPELKVVEETPTWLKGDELKSIEANRTFDIEKEPSGWLATLVKERK